MIIKPTAKLAIALWIVSSLLLAQFMGLHLHVQHENASSSDHTHLLDIHSSTVDHGSHHDIFLDTTTISEHHSTSFDMNQDSLLKYAASLLGLIVLALSSWLLLSPLNHYYSRYTRQPLLLKSFFYLLQPPLRAPPVK